VAPLDYLRVLLSLPYSGKLLFVLMIVFALSVVL
jgi:hypothetical protein